MILYAAEGHSIGCCAEHYRQIARPFDWTFTRADLNRLLARIETHTPKPALAA